MSLARGLLDRGWGKPGMSLEVSNRQILPSEEREALFLEVIRISNIAS
jgi:hypothetical protein